MAQSKPKLADKLAQPFGTSVYYFCSTEVEPLRAAAQKVSKALLSHPDGADTTRLDGPGIDFGAVIEAAGSLSFFGTPRVIELREIVVSSLSDKDAAELATLFADVQNAVFLITVLHKDKRTAGSKKSKLLFDAAAKAGYAEELQKPTRQQNIAYIGKVAQHLGAQFAPGAEEVLLDRAGEDRPLLANETQKLAAISGYTQISIDMVNEYATDNTEADVFQLARAITARQRREAYARLDKLLVQKHEPIAIAAALSGTFVDMYRVRCGAEIGLAPAAVGADLGYTGSPYRLQKAKENAARYTTAELETCLLELGELDAALKSSPLPDKSVLLTTTIARLMRPSANK